MDENKIMSISDLKNKYKDMLQAGEVCFIRIPLPEKESAKENGAKWDMIKNMYFFRSELPESHPLYELRTTNKDWMMLKGNIPFNLMNDFKTYGVVNEKDENGEWKSWVLGVERYTELIAALYEIELL